MQNEEDFNDEENFESTVDLGFLEKTESWRLKSEFFPSKVGGKPSWLNFADIPESCRMLCDLCKGPCLFLCQMYAPIENDDECFHRTLFVFMCPNIDCCQPNKNDNFKVIRCQLPRANEYFSPDPPVESENWTPSATAENFGKLCRVCNLRGSSHCGKCRSVNYCSRQHQVVDWKAGHKQECNIEGESLPSRTIRQPPLLLPEWELVTEPEPKKDASPSERSDIDKLTEYQRLVETGQAGTMHGDAAAEAELQEMPDSKEDATFKKFKLRIARSPTQVLRYERSGNPLWVSEASQNSPVPPCELCGEPRIFECQILPQLLNYLKIDQVDKSIDWGTLAIFTCQKSCSGGPSYKDEVIVKQDFVK